MFGRYKTLEKRVKKLEDNLNEAKRKKDCADGDHEWEMRGENTLQPWVRCKYCYKFPEKTS